MSHGADVDIDDDGDDQRGYGDYGGNDDDVIAFSIVNGMPMIFIFKDNGATPVPRGPGECPSATRRPWGRSSGAQGHGVPWKGPEGPRGEQ